MQLLQLIFPGKHSLPSHSSFLLELYPWTLHRLPSDLIWYEWQITLHNILKSCFNMGYSGYMKNSNGDAHPSLRFWGLRNREHRRLPHSWNSCDWNSWVQQRILRAFALVDRRLREVCATKVLCQFGKQPSRTCNVLIHDIWYGSPLSIFSSIYLCI